MDLRTGVPVAEGKTIPGNSKGGGQSGDAGHFQPLQPTDLQFGDTHFNIVDRNGQVWLRGQQIGNALGYHDGQKKIFDLYNRNADEFTDSMTALVKLPDLHPRNGDAGQMREVRIFSLRGCHLLGMLARTEKAKEFRRWVLDVLDKEVASQKPSPVPAPANLLPGLNVGEEEFFLAAYNALGREKGLTTLIVQLVKMGALNQWVSASLNQMVEMSGGRLSRSNVAYNGKRLTGQGLIDHKGSQWYVFGEVLRALLPGLGEAGEGGSLLANNSGIACDKITVH